MSVGVVNKQTGDRIPTAGMPAIDNALDLTSVNPVQNAVITAALAGKADTGIVADDFDSTASYVIGNYCIENGKLYRFKANHSGAWSASDVEEVKIAGELSSLKSGLNNVSARPHFTKTINATGNWTVTDIQLNDYPDKMIIINFKLDGDSVFRSFTVTPDTIGATTNSYCIYHDNTGSSGSKDIAVCKGEVTGFLNIFVGASLTATTFDITLI